MEYGLPEEASASLPSNIDCEDQYRTALFFSLPMLCPLMIDTLLDYFSAINNTNGTTTTTTTTNNTTNSFYNIELVRFLLLLSFFIPNLTIYAVTGDKPMLFITTNLFQVIMLFCSLMQLLALSDCSYWNIDRLNILAALHVTCFIGVVSYFAAVPFLPFLFFFGLFEIIYFCYLYGNMLCIYYHIMFSDSESESNTNTNSKVGTENNKTTLSTTTSLTLTISLYLKRAITTIKTIYSMKNLTSDQINTCLYGSCIVVLLLCVIILPSLPDQLMPTRVYFVIASYATTVVLVILTVFPGRLARLMVVKSDVCMIA